MILGAASACSGFADLVDLPEKLGKLGVLDPLIIGTASPYVWGTAGLAAFIALIRTTRLNPEAGPSWRAEDQARAAIDYPGYPALIQFQVLVLDMTDAEATQRIQVSPQVYAEMRANPTDFPRPDIIRRMHRAFLLPEDACGPNGALRTGRMPSDSLMSLRLTRLGHRRLVSMLASDGHDLLPEVSAGQVRDRQLREVYAVAMTARYQYLGLPIGKGAV